MDQTTVTIEGDNRPPVYWEGKFLIIRASAIGNSCLWELIAAGQGYEPGLLPASLIRAFREGHQLEPVVVKLMQDDGWTFLGHQAQGHLVCAPGLMIRYHYDGMAYPPPVSMVDESTPERVVEIKALSDGLWQIAKAGSVADCIDEYAWQLSTMMHAEGKPGVWVAYNKGLPPDPKTGVRPPCPDQGKLLYEYVDGPPIPSIDIVRKANAVLDGVLGEDILTSDRPCEDPTHWPCRYIHLRPEPEGHGEGAILVPDSDKEEVDSAIKEYLYHRGQADEHKARAEDAKSRILAMAADSDKLITDRWVIPITKSTSTWHSFKDATEEDRAVIDKYKRSKPIRYVGKIKPLT